MERKKCEYIRLRSYIVVFFVKTPPETSSVACLTLLDRYSEKSVKFYENLQSKQFFRSIKKI